MIEAHVKLVSALAALEIREDLPHWPPLASDLCRSEEVTRLPSFGFKL